MVVCEGRQLWVSSLRLWHKMWVTANFDFSVFSLFATVVFFLICSSNSWRQSLERSRRRSHLLKWPSNGTQFTFSNSQWIICYKNVHVSLCQAFVYGTVDRNGEQKMGEGFGTWGERVPVIFARHLFSLPVSHSLTALAQLLSFPLAIHHAVP